MSKEIIFGTDGWRALLDSEMNEESVALTAQAFSDYCRDSFTQPVVAIGYDGRRNSKIFSEIFAAVLRANGINVLLSDRIIPTPVLSFFVRYNNLNAGVMITASHNPPEYNGIKFKASYGGPFTTEETHKVESYLGKSEIKKSSDIPAATNLIEPYIDHINSMVNFEEIQKRNIKLLVDSMSGAGGTLIQEILGKNNCSAFTIFGRPEPDFSGRLAEPIENNLRPLRVALKEKAVFSMGTATDGDADRLGVLTDKGDWLSAQDTILLLTDYIKNYKKIEGDLVVTSSVTDKIRTFFDNSKCKVHEVQVGFKYICETMLNYDVAFGAEESGGFGFKGHIPERDGILSALLTAEMLAASGFEKLSELIAVKREEFGETYYDRIDYKYLKDDRQKKLPQIYESNPGTIASFPVKKIGKYLSSRDIINGLKFYLEGNSRWLLLRASETEPLVRIYAEANSGEEVNKLLEYGVELINKF